MPYYQCQRCTACCRWPGFVKIELDEVEGIANFLGVSEDAFIQQYTVLRPSRTGLALIQNPEGGHACIFLKGNDCMIQSVKPKQCKGFPNEWNFPGWRDICHAVEVENPS